MSDPRNHFVYRAYDEAGRLLYVGVTRSPSTRRAWHRYNSAWFTDVTSVRMTGPLPASDARDLEFRLICDEAPLHNISGRPTREPRPVVNGGVSVDGETYLSARDAAAELGISRRALLHRIAKGRVPAIKHGNGKTCAYMIPRSAVSERAA